MKDARMTSKDLKKAVDFWDKCLKTEDERDEFLTDLLCYVYRSKTAQDS